MKSCLIKFYVSMSEASDTEDRVRGIVADVLQRTCTSICHDAATSIRCIECRREESLKHGSLKWSVHDALRDYKARVLESIVWMCVIIRPPGKEMFPYTRETLAKTVLSGKELCPN